MSMNVPRREMSKLAWCAVRLEFRMKESQGTTYPSNTPVEFLGGILHQYIRGLFADEGYKTNQNGQADIQVLPNKLRGLDELAELADEFISHCFVPRWLSLIVVVIVVVVVLCNNHLAPLLRFGIFQRLGKKVDRNNTHNNYANSKDIGKPKIKGGHQIGADGSGQDLCQCDAGRQSEQCCSSGEMSEWVHLENTDQTYTSSSVKISAIITSAIVLRTMSPPPMSLKSPENQITRRGKTFDHQPERFIYQQSTFLPGRVTRTNKPNPQFP